MLAEILLITILALSCADYLTRRRSKAPRGKWKTGLKLPPGPARKPLVGSFFEFGQVLEPAAMTMWKRKYGDIVSIDLFGSPVVFVSSDETAQELLEKRGALYSDRAPFHMALLLGWTYNVGLMQYGEWWRRHIRLLHQFFNSRAVVAYEPVQTKACRRVLAVLYAIDIKREGDSFIHTVHTALEGLSFALVPGLWIVDVFPILRCIPDWIPSIPFKKFSKKYRKETETAAEIPFSIVKSRESPDHSFVSTSLERLSRLTDPLPHEEDVIRGVAGTAYAAGASTSFATLLQAVVASILNPEAQKKMHEELDRVLGDRLPTLADHKDLPYVNAFCAEVLRWRPAAPLGVPHAVLEDDIYGDYFIPKGSTVIANIWEILRDKKYGPDPETFNPDRFFQPGIPLPNFQFGFGRRVCPGRFFASNTLFLFVASIFKVFNVTPVKDEYGNDIPVTDRIIESSLPLPEPFRCSFKLRSPLSKQLIQGE